MTQVPPFQRLTLAVALGCASVVSAGSAEFIPLGDLPGGDFHSISLGISGDGSTVIGWSKASDSLQGQYRAFRWREDIGITSLGHIGTPTENSQPSGVSFDGSVIVGTSGEAFRWIEATGMQPIGSCHALGISGDGTTVVGFCPRAIGNVAATWSEADGWLTFGALGPVIVDAFFFDSNHDGSVFTGQSFMEQPNVEPTRWTAERGMVALGDIPGGLHYGLGLAISADGSTIVGDAIGDVGQDAFMWTDATGLINLELAEFGDVTDSMAHDVSGDGSIIVGFSDNHGAMIWDAAHGMRSIQQMLADLHGVELPGWTLIGAEAISDNGRAIAGHGTNPNGDFEAWLIRLPPFCAAGDVNGNNSVDVFDLLDLLAVWGVCGGCSADFTDSVGGRPDGVVDVFDLLVLLDHWGDCPIP